MTKQFDDIVKTLDESEASGQPQPSSELYQLGRLVADGQTWTVCENITNLFNQVTTAINYARNNSLLNHELVGKAIEQGVGHLQGVLNSLAQAAQEAQAEEENQQVPIPPDEPVPTKRTSKRGPKKA